MPAEPTAATARRARKVYWLINRRCFGLRVHILHGSHAWEVQVGTHVFQWFYRDSVFHESNGSALHHWTDE